MKITFNIDEEINKIKTGDTVLIAGLYGKNFSFINNRCGIIKAIFVRVENGVVIPLANVAMLDTGMEYIINFDFIYSLNFNRIVDTPSQHIFTIENPFVYYVRRKNIKHTMHFQDEIGQWMGIGVDKNSKSHVILLSGIN